MVGKVLRSPAQCRKLLLQCAPEKQGLAEAVGCRHRGISRTPWPPTLADKWAPESVREREIMLLKKDGE